MRAFRIAYDGTDYRGFQRQPHENTIEDELLSALSALGVTDGIPPGYAAAGRTDAGVSALAQTVCFEAPPWLTPAAFGSELPADIRPWAVADVPETFHATHDATERAYRYALVAPPETIDDDRVSTACRRLSGTHDFHNLTTDDEGTRRRLSVDVTRNPTRESILYVDARAGGFPRGLVRRLVSLLSSIGRDERSLDALDRVLDPRPLSGPDGVPPAPPEPLLLREAVYPEVSFAVDGDAARRARGAFEERRRRRLAGVSVADELSDIGT
ncbi:MAG: tRNA pseudouridine(38-40) synthase TruA [Natronomonas sp.]